MEKPCFLYVEDNPTSREVMEVLITMSMGYTQLTILEDSTEFIQKAEKLEPRPTVIFLDIHVKPYDGFQMLEMLREHPDLKDIVIIAVTASVMSEEVHMLKKAGFDGGIAKPINPITFPDLIQRILNHEKVWYIS